MDFKPRRGFQTILATLIVSLCSELVKAAEFLQPIPYLYFSVNDSSTNYIEFTKYYSLEGTINPVLEANSSTKLKLVQPFEFSNLTTTPVLPNNLSLQNCTATTTSISEYGAMVCKNNFFFIYSVDKVLAKQDLNTIDDPTFVQTGSLLCQSAFIDLELALSFVTCLKKNDTAAGIEVMAVQLLDNSVLEWRKLNWLIPESPDGFPNHTKAVVTDITKRPNNETNLMVQSLDITMVVGSPYLADQDKTAPTTLYELGFTISISNTQITLVKTKDNLEKLDIKSFFGERTVTLIDLVGAPEERFYETFNSSLMLVAQDVGDPSTYLSEYDVSFVRLERSDGGFTKPTSERVVKAQFKEKTQVMLDSRFLYIANPTQTDSGVNMQLKRVDIFSFFNGFYTEKSAIICNSLEFLLEYNQTNSSQTNNGATDQDAPVTTLKMVSSPNLLAGIVTIASPQLDQNMSYFFVWDLASLSLRKLDSTAMKISSISMTQTNGESLVVFPYFSPGTSRIYLGKMSSSRAYIGVPNLKGEFNLTAQISYQTVIGSNSDPFNLTGTFINNMSTFISLPTSYFEQSFSYYTQLTYDIFLPWHLIRGVDITISPQYVPTDVLIKPINIETQNLNLDVPDLSPDIYYIKGDFLVLMTKNITAHCVTIMIFKVQSVEIESISYKSENNYSICMPATGLGNPVLDANRTQLRNVEVLFDNILALVELVYTVGPLVPKNTFTNATLLSFYGPNYLKGNKSIPLEAPGFYAAIVPNIETVCYLVLSSTKDYKSTFLAVYNITMENMDLSELIALFNQSSNIRPAFCPIQLFPDTIDNQYLIVVSSCPSKPADSKTYTMKLDLFRLVVSEYQKERLIDKSGNICPASGSFVSINSTSIVGYILPPGKSVFSSVQFYMNDFEPSKPYEAICFINKNLLVVSQTRQEYNPSHTNYTLKTIAYIFSTDSTVEADRRMLQRVAFPGEIQKLTVNCGDDVVYLQPTSDDTFETDLVRYVVYLKKKEVQILYNISDGFTGERTAQLEFNTIDRTVSKIAPYLINFSNPLYSATLEPYSETSISPENLNGSLIDSLFNVTGPVYGMSLVASNQTEPALSDNNQQIPSILDGWIESKVAIRAPIFSYFDLFQGVDQEVFVGIVNYPYGFDICVLDAKFLQYPQVTSISGLNAISAKTILLNDKLYLFVYSSDISDGYTSLSTYYTNSQDYQFSSGVSYSSTLFTGEMDVQLLDPTVPRFLTTFFSNQDAITYFFIVNFRELNSDALADINPFSRLINVAQVQMVSIPDFDAVFVIYRKQEDTSSLYYRVWETPGGEILNERPVFENSTTFRGTNELLKCSSFGDTIDCVMAVEGNYFVEVKMNVTKSSFRPSDPLPVPTLQCLSTKQYSVYVNNKIERIDFSQQYIYAQTKKTLQNETDVSGPSREILIYNRDPSASNLYKGIPCSQYSQYCTGPVNLVPWSANQTFFASQTGLYLVQSLTVRNRTLYVPTGFDMRTWGNFEVVVTNPFSPYRNSTANFTSLVKIYSVTPKTVLSFRTWIGFMFIAFPLVISLIAFQRDIKKRKLNQLSQEGVYFPSDDSNLHRSTQEDQEMNEEIVNRRKNSKQTNDSSDEQKIPSAVFDGPTHEIKRNLAKSMRNYSYEEQSPSTP